MAQFIVVDNHYSSEEGFHSTEDNRVGSLKQGLHLAAERSLAKRGRSFSILRCTGKGSRFAMRNPLWWDESCHVVASVKAEGEGARGTKGAKGLQGLKRKR